MGLFGKKKATQSDVQTASVANSSSQPKKKKKDTMAAVLHESVTETAIEEMSHNQAFIVSQNNETKYACLLLRTADIGGLTKKSNKDEAKGSIIEQMNSGAIFVYISPQLMDDENIVIVPSAQTLQAMSEYSLLIQAPYELCLVHTDGGVELTGTKMSYSNAKSIVVGDADIWNFLASEELQEEEIPEETEEIEAEDTDDTDDEDESEDDRFDTVPDDDDMPFHDEDGDLSENEEEFYDEPDADESFEPDSFIGESDETSNDELSDEESEEEEAEDEDIIPDDLITEVITRKFYSDDLGLEATTEPFDVQFLHGNPYIPFDENRGDGFLDQYLNQMARNANAEMKRLHQDNLFRMREFYFHLISAHCEEIQQQLDTSDATTQFGRLFDSLRQQKISNESELEQTVEEERAKLEKDWEQKLTMIGEEAAADAKRSYRERFGNQHDAEVNAVELNLQDKIEQAYQNNIRTMNQNRKIEASKRMDYGINKALQEVTKMYMELLQKENERYHELADEMQAYVDANRKDEIARSQALAEELSQKNKADEVLKEYTEKMKNLSAEFDLKVRSLQTDLAKMERDNEAKLQNKDDEWSAKLDDANDRNKELQDQLDRLLDKYSRLDEFKDQEYQARLQTLQNEKTVMESQYNHVVSVHKKNNTVSALLVVAIAIVMLASGFIIGSFINIKYDTEDTSKQIQQQIESEYEQYYNTTESSVDSNSSTTVKTPSVDSNNRTR